MKAQHCLAFLALLFCAAPLSATPITFDFESNVTVTPNPNFANTVTQIVGDFEVSLDLAQFNGLTANDDVTFNFLGPSAPFNVAITVNNIATGENGIAFSLESVTVGDVAFIESAAVSGSFDNNNQFTVPADFSSAAGGSVVVSTGSASDLLVDVFTVSFQNDATTMRGANDFGVDFPSIDDIVISVVPEPTSVMLLGVATAGFLARRRR